MLPVTERTGAATAVLRWHLPAVQDGENDKGGLPSWRHTGLQPLPLLLGEVLALPSDLQG